VGLWQRAGGVRTFKPTRAVFASLWALFSFCNATLKYFPLQGVILFPLSPIWTQVASTPSPCRRPCWRVQPTAARRSGRFNKMGGALSALHASLNNASTRTVRKWFKRNNDLLVTPNLNGMEISCLGATHKAILKLSFEVQNSFWIKSRTSGEDMG